MKIARFFLQEEWDVTGSQGFSALWVPKSCGFDPGGAQIMLHDMLEHRMMDRGHFHEELMAFGRLIALRAMPGHGFSGGFMSIERSLGVELAGIWSNAESDRHSVQGIPDAPPTVLDGSPEWFIDKVCAGFNETVASELGGNDADQSDHALTSRFKTMMKRWLHIGFHDAVRRYGSVDHGCYDVGQAAVRWRESRQKFIEDLANDAPGCVLRLEFDTERLQFRERVYEPNDYGFFPKWLEAKIRWYRTARANAAC